MDSQVLSEMSRIPYILDVRCDSYGIPSAKKPREGSIACC
eukprot:CCRYP_009056-RA/>CCRYP_009056-RA protein AED:0.00 eAED:0.00 QI:59/1/1/1/0/0/2/49/39